MAKVFAKVVAYDIQQLVAQYGYRIQINERRITDSWGDARTTYDMLLIYPSYCKNVPYRLHTFSEEFTPQEMLDDPQVVSKVLRIINQNNGGGLFVTRMNK